MSAKNFLYIDIETSGLNPEEGAVMFSIGAVADLRGKKNVGMVTEFEQYIIPTPEQWALASPAALERNGITLEVLMERGKSVDEVRIDFLTWLAENKIDATNYVYVGQNPAFDLKFLRYFWLGDLMYVGFPFTNPIDNRDLYSILVNHRLMPWLDKKRGGRTSENISSALGVPPEPWPHTALEGARAVMRNHRKMLEVGNGIFN